MKRLLVFLLFTSIFYSQNEKDLVLFKINDSETTLGEFYRVYNKNIDLVEDSKDNDYMSYLELFINYKLKLAEAYDLGYDKNEDYQKEYKKYKNQLLKGYLTDSESQERLVKEAYERTRNEVQVSHILIRNNDQTNDSSEIYNRLSNLRQPFLEKNIQTFNKEHNFDKQLIVEDLGYFSAFKMIYEFENIAYNTEVGEVSKPFKTKFGFHILKVTDKRESMGEISVSHIMIYKKNTNAKEKIIKILDSINKGSSFESMAKLYSQDKRSAARGGVLNKFSSGQINSIPFENAAFSLKNIGEISNPIETKFGWHIIKLLSKNEIKSFDELKPSILSKIRRGARNEYISNSFNQFLDDKYNLSMENIDYKFIITLLNDSITKNKWKINYNDFKFQEPLFVINQKTIFKKDFLQFVEKNQSFISSKDFEQVANNLFSRFYRKILLDEYKKDLERENSEYNNILTEYREGLLMFNIMQEKVWSIGEKDSIVLREFYIKNIDKYDSFETNRGKIIADYQNEVENNWIENLRKTNSIVLYSKAMRRLKKMYK
ncbi:MAG: peptidylprolyl isomerase [Flavobacteriaceae bacterium]|tara:strand:+ start:1857 stop:3491 length:1635 start_codon:yes stop_codon:yes gene_type:complete